MSDYERVRASCIQRNQLWVDPEFPAEQTSVFYHQVPPFTFEWKRPRELYKDPVFIHTQKDTSDVVSGRLGDKWLLSCVRTLYSCTNLFFRVVPADQSFDQNYAGVFRFRLWWCGRWVEVMVDDRLPTLQGNLAFMHSTLTEQLWPALLEKAYAKLHGSYEALKYGNMSDGLAEWTGGISESIAVSEITEANALNNLLKTTSIVTASMDAGGRPQATDYLEPGINYRIYDVKKVESTIGSIHLVHLGHPTMVGGFTHVILNHSVWNSLPLSERISLMSINKGFWMLYMDFKSVFNRLELVHLDGHTSAGEPTFSGKQQWLPHTHQGRWRKGVNAGGCRYFFHINPQIQIELDKSDMVIISLYQHCIVETKVIGFSIYRIPKALEEKAPLLFFRVTKSSINSQYTNSRQVSLRCALEAGVYLVIPTTFEPRQEANYSLRMFSITPLKMKVLDYAPQVLRGAVIKAPTGADSITFIQYESQFLQLADEHKTINAFELQELLELCLPNDYIKSCATIETCRQIVLSLEKDGIGRISLSDFRDLICSLKYWLAAFREHAPEKIGVLRAERLRDALREVGFVVPDQTLSLLLHKYVRNDGMLRFGDFVSAVVLLDRTFNGFCINSATTTSNINMTFSEWLKSTFMF